MISLEGSTPSFQGVASFACKIGAGVKGRSFLGKYVDCISYSKGAIGEDVPYYVYLCATCRTQVVLSL